VFNDSFIAVMLINNIWMAKFLKLCRDEIICLLVLWGSPTFIIIFFTYFLRTYKDLLLQKKGFVMGQARFELTTSSYLR